MAAPRADDRNGTGPRRRLGRRRTPPSERSARVLYGVTVPQSAATLLRGQLGWLRERGWDVHLVTAPGRHVDIVRKREGVVTHTVPMDREINPRRDLPALIGWIRLLRRLRPDVVNVGTPKAALLGSIAAWLLRVRVRVYVMRGLRLEGAQGGPQQVLLWLAERLTVLLATDVVCVSHSLRDEARARKLVTDRDRPVVLGHGSSNGVNGTRWDAGLAAVDREQIRAGWGIGPGEMLFGFVGRIAYDKGVADLLDAFVQLADVPARLLLVGPVESHELASVIAGLGEKVVHVGWTDDLYSVYAGIDVLCLPTRREGFPNVVLEAAVARVPTITTTATGARDSVVPDVTGWRVPEGDVPALAAAMRARALDVPGVRAAGEAARRRALQDFRPESIWQGLEAIYLAAWDRRLCRQRGH